MTMVLLRLSLHLCYTRNGVILSGIGEVRDAISAT